MIDKSIRADYAIQGGGPNYLGKQKMVKAPKKWKSSPDHEPAELAYITDKEKDILIDLDIYGSLNGKPNRGPSGIISLQGDLGGYSGSGGSSSSGGGGDGNRDRFRTHPKPTPTVTRSRIQEETQKQFEEDQAARVREILTRGRGTEKPGERLFEDRISKAATPEIKSELVDGQIIGREYNAEAIQKAAKTQARERALGIGTPLTTEEITSLPLGTRIEDLVPTQEKKDTRTLTQKLTQPTFTKEGITKTSTDFAKNQAINLAAQKVGLSGVLSFANPLMALYGFLGGGKKDPLRSIRKQISKFKKPDIDTQKESTKKFVKHDPKGNEEATIAKQVAGGEDVVTKTAAKFTGMTDEQAEFMKRRKIVQGILDQGSYQGKELTGEDRNNLLNYIEQISKFIVDPMEVAYGGRIDKALGGRSRDI